MIVYDRSVLNEMAQLLYDEADKIQMISAVKYGLGFGVIGAVVGSFMGASSSMFASSSSGDGKGVLGFLIGAAVGAFVGWTSASIRALLLKVEAQKLLCQAEIEVNTKTAKPA